MKMGKNCSERAHLKHNTARNLGVHLGFGDNLPNCCTIQIKALSSFSVKTTAKVSSEGGKTQ